MEYQKISVIIPVYNVELYIRKCLDSVIFQTYRNLEIIIIDDGSKDNSRTICNEYAEKDSRIFVIHQDNAGLAAARNAGLDRASGEWIAFLDSDDWIEPEMYETLFHLALANNADIASCKTRIVTLEGNIKALSDDNSITILEPEEMIAGLLTQQKVRFEVWNKLWRRSLIGDIRFKVGQVSEDVYFDRVLFLKANRMVHIDRTLHNYLVSRPGNTNSSFKNARLSIFSEFDALIDELKTIRRFDTAKIVICIASNFAISIYTEALRTNQSDVVKNKIKHYYRKYHRDAIHSRYSNKKAMVLFDFNPRLYSWVLSCKQKKSINRA